MREEERDEWREHREEGRLRKGCSELLLMGLSVGIRGSRKGVSTASPSDSPLVETDSMSSGYLVLSSRVDSVPAPEILNLTWPRLVNFVLLNKNRHIHQLSLLDLNERTRTINI